MEKKRINNKLPVAWEGLPFILTTLVLTLFFIQFELTLPAMLMGILCLFTVCFFRDPERKSDGPEKAIFTPADGKIIHIKHLTDQDNPLGKPAVLVSIFMSIFNVHVNRIPISGKVSKITYHSGRFFSANLDKASEENENNRLLLETHDGRSLITVQIAGLIARRIVCWLKEGDEVTAGQRFGLIRFGSRLDVYLPADTQIIVEQQGKVKAGKTIIGYLS